MSWRNIIILFTSIVFIMVFLWPKLSDKIFSAQPSSKNQAVTVNTIIAKSSLFTIKIPAYAFIENEVSDKITSQIAGRINKIYVKDSQTVMKNDLLMEISATKSYNTLEAAHKRFREAQNKHSRAVHMKEQNFISHAEFETIEADLTNKKVEYENSKIEYEKSHVKSPYLGIIKLAVKIGSIVNIGDTLAYIDTPEDKMISLNLPVKYRKKIKLGQVVEVFDENNEVRYSGSITSVGNIINAETQTFNIKAKFKTNDEMMVGEYVKARISIDAIEVVKLPHDAIIYENEKYYVYTAQNHQAVKVAVDIEYKESNHTYIKGIKPNDIVIVSGHIKLSEMQEVIEMDIDNNLLNHTVVNNEI